MKTKSHRPIDGTRVSKPARGIHIQEYGLHGGILCRLIHGLDDRFGVGCTKEKLRDESGTTDDRAEDCHDADAVFDGERGRFRLGTV